MTWKKGSRGEKYKSVFSPGVERRRRDSTGGINRRERTGDIGGEVRRGEGRHDISLACADSSSFVTVAAINNSTVLSLWIIRVGLSALFSPSPSRLLPLPRTLLFHLTHTRAPSRVALLLPCIGVGFHVQFGSV